MGPQPALPAPEDFWQGHLQEHLALATLYDREAFIEFMESPVDPASSPRFRRRFGGLFGWTPAQGATEWESLRPVAERLPLSIPYTSFHPLRAAEPFQPPSLQHLVEDDSPALLERLLSNRRGVEFLCTGLLGFRKEDLPFDGDCRLSLLPHPLDAAEMLVVDSERTDVEERYASLSHFFLRRWNPSEIQEWFLEYGAGDGRGKRDLYFATDPERLEGALRAFEYLAKDERQQRPAHLDPSALRRRSFWLFGHPGGDPHLGFARELGQAPAITDWEVEIELFPTAPWLACYWMLAHLYLNNDEAARRTASIALQIRGEIPRDLGIRVLRILEDPEKAGMDVAAFHELRETTLMCARPWQLEPAARKRREELLAGLAGMGLGNKPDLWPAFLLKL